MANGYTYSYFQTKSRNGEECCLPIKSKCGVNKNFGFTCQIMRGQNKCGKGCSRIIKSLKKTERQEKKKKEKKEYSSEGLSSAQFKAASLKKTERQEKKKKEYSSEGLSSAQFKAGKGLKVKKGQKLSQRQLEMLVAATEEKPKASTNPLCKDVFRFL